MAILNKRKFLYPNIIGLNNNITYRLDKDGIVRRINNENIAWLSDSISPILYATQTNSHTIMITENREVWIPISGSYLYNVTQLNNAYPVYAGVSHSFTKILDEETNYTDCYNGAYCVVTKNGDLYIFGRSNNGQLPLSIVPDNSDIVPPTKIILPNNEKAFMARIWSSLECVILTLKGNVYRFNLKTETFNKLDISNITHMCLGDCNHLHLVGEDGSLYYASTNGGSIVKFSDITDAKSVWGDNSNSGMYAVVLTHSNKVYFTYNSNIIYTYELEDDIPLAGCDSATYLHTAKFSTASGKIYCFSRPNDSFDYYLSNIYEPNLKEFKVENYGIYINLDIDNYEYEYKSNISNITYKFKFIMYQNLNIDGTRNVVNYVTSKKWTPSGCLGLIFFFL